MPRPRGLTPERIAALSPPAKGGRYEIPDGKTPNLFVRVGRLTKVFVLQTRIARRTNSNRIKIGVFPETTLERARAVAAEWNALIERGIDPREEDARREREEKLKKRRTFRSAMEDYIAWLPQRDFNRHVPEDIATLRREFLDPVRNPWMDGPIADVRESMVKELVKAIRDRPAQTQAYNTLSLVKRFFDWAVEEHGDDYGLTADPIAGLTHKRLKLRRRKRKRSLDAVELRAYWMAAEATPYPYGPLYRLVVLLGGRRKRECSEMRWSEIDWARRLWIIPLERVKHGDELLELHVPLTKEAVALLEELRRNQPEGWGDCVFSTTNGQIPINGGSKAMAAFQSEMEARFQQLRPGAVMKGWVLHDLRRVVRTALSTLGVDDEVAERVIGHRRKEDYNQDKFRPQVRRALVLFTRRLLEVADGSAADFVADDLSDFD